MAGLTDEACKMGDAPSNLFLNINNIIGETDP